MADGKGKDFYEVLGVTKSSSEDDIRRAYRKLARKFHPDVNPGDRQAEDSFKRVAAAYDVLGDADKRKAYDEFGEESLKGGFDPEKARAYQQWKTGREQTGRPFENEAFEFNLEDLFGGAGFGGFAGAGGRRRTSRGQDILAVAELDLAQVVSGTEVSVDVPGQGPTKIRIPPGAEDGSTLRIKGKGAPAPAGGAAGDLVIETRVRPHPFVERDGLDLVVKVPVTLDEAYNGGAIEVPLFGGGSVKVKVPPRSQPGTRLRLRGKGIERKSKKGDLYVHLDVRLPDKSDEQLAAALREAARAYQRPVREGLRL